MQGIIKALNKLVADDDIEELKVVSDYKTMETTVSFCFYYVEFLADEPFFLLVLPSAKSISIDGLGDDEGRGMMTLIFDGVLDREAN